MFRLSMTLIALATLLFISTTHAQEVPMVSDDPIVNRDMDNDMFDFISKTLGSGKMGSHMQCTLKTRNTRELRKFASGKEWVEILEVDFNSNGFDSGYKLSFKIPSNARYGIKKTTNQWSGIGEDIKVELGDRYGHWLRFTHDGQGRLVQLMLGNDLKTTPCQIK